MTLYQIDQNAVDEGVADTLAGLFALGVLVPVEPDYKAAEDKGKTLVAWLHTPMVVHPDTYRDFVKASTRGIVDAALGVGENLSVTDRPTV